MSEQIGSELIGAVESALPHPILILSPSGKVIDICVEKLYICMYRQIGCLSVVTRVRRCI
jgi:hypothetical protein